MTTARALILVSLLALLACEGQPPPTTTPEKPATSYEQFGEGVDQPDGAVAVAEVLADPAAFADRDVKLSGPITSVCQKKGCWMRVGEGEQTVFVRFKDYGFFVPLDCSGRRVVMRGKLTVKEQSVEEVRHYLEDAGKHEEAKQVTEPRKVVTFMATGVAIENE